MNKNNMKKILKILILPIAIITMLGSFSNITFADAPLSVQFVPNPLFNKINFLPLDETFGTVTVTNNSGETQTILTEAINVLDNNNFGSQLHITIVGSSGTLFDNTLANFLSTAGEVSLGTILNGESKTFTYTVSFINSSDNSYQGKTLGFDVCVGFEGGTRHCGDTIIDDGGGTIPGTGGGGGGGSSISLIIFNEQALNITNVGASGSATITWNTNLLSTSQVVYGLASGGPYTLVLTPPNFGYPLFIIEDPTKVINHSMFLNGLVPGQTYLYRVISRASPPTISPEHQFTVPLSTSLLAQTSNPPGLVLGASTSGGGLTSGGGDSGEEIGSSGNVLGETTSNIEETPSVNPNLATAFTSGFSNPLSNCNLISLLILLILYLIWRFWLRKKYEKLNMPEEEILERSYIFFGGTSLVVILVSIALGNYCPLLIFVITFVISVCLYAYFKLKVR